MENITDNYYINVYDIYFYISDDDGNPLIDDNGNERKFRLKDSIRFKPLEYLTEDLNIDYLEEIKK